MVTHPSCCCQPCGLGTSPSQCDGDGLPLGSPPASRLWASTGVTETWRETQGHPVAGNSLPLRAPWAPKQLLVKALIFPGLQMGLLRRVQHRQDHLCFTSGNTIGPLGRLQSTKLIAEIACDVNLASSQLCSSCGPLTLCLVGTRT